MITNKTSVWNSWTRTCLITGVLALALFILVPSRAFAADPVFKAELLIVKAVQEGDGVRLDWRMRAGPEFASGWLVEVQNVCDADGRLWQTVPQDVAFGPDFDDVEMSAWVPAPASVTSVVLRVWAGTEQERPSEGVVVRVREPLKATQTTVVLPKTQTRAAPVVEGERIKVTIKETARYTVSAEEIAARLAEIGEETVRTWIAATNLAVTCMDKPVAWHSVGTHDGIAFIGRAYRDIYTENNVYWITPGPGLGMGTITAESPPESQESGAFWQETRNEHDRELFSLLPAEYELDCWYWNSVSTHGSMNKSSIFLPFDTPGATDEGTATLRLWTRSTSVLKNQAPHGSLTLSLDEALISAFALTSGPPEVLTCSFPQSLLGETNVLQVTGAHSNGVRFIYYGIDSLTIGYQRRMLADDGALIVDVEEAEQAVVASGFPSADIAVYSLPETDIVKRLTGTEISQTGTVWQCAFTAPTNVVRLLLTSRANAPEDIQGVVADGWAGTDHVVDYLVVSPTEFLETLNPLLTLRSSHLRVGVVTTEELYVHNNGGRFSPYALREFLRKSRSWRCPPKMVLLVGNGHFDYKQAFGTSAWLANQIPPALNRHPDGDVGSGWRFVGTDNDLADLDGDGVPDLAIGRLPARDQTELARMVTKTLDYEANRLIRTNAVVVADLKLDSLNFEVSASEWMRHLPSRLAQTFLSEPSGGTTRMKRKTIRDAWQAQINAGVWISTYFGHASEHYLGQELCYLEFENLDSLTNEGKTGLLLGMTCRMNHLFLPREAETWAGCIGSKLFRGINGGMVAVLATTSPSFEIPSRIIANAFADSIFQHRRRYLGEGVRDALTTLRQGGSTVPWLTQTFLLLGDPALDLRPAEGILPEPGTLFLVY